MQQDPKYGSEDESQLRRIRVGGEGGVRDAGGVQTVRFDPAKSMTLGTFRFAAGGGNYIEFESAGATGEVVVRKVRLIPNR